MESIFIFIILNILRKTLQKAGGLGEWKNILLGGVVLTAVALVLSIVFSHTQQWIHWIAYAILGGLYYIVFTKKEFRSVKPVMFAFSPMLGINFLEAVVRLISRSFYEKWDNYFEVGELLALVWMIAMLISNSKQKKALEKVRLKNEEKEKEFQITQKLKAELEEQVQERTAEITRQKEELQHALNDLQATQAQLVQSEKMASLGELTAGIAHEIQNPLNFVNNFSEVSNELIAEMNEELAKGDYEEAKAIAEDIKQNLEKINHHGKRADAIVKGMLQHSRSSDGKKEPTDINALADEYLRLSYHGLRAKDKSFNATLQTDFDTSIGQVNIVSQDIGRVIMNLLTNAFYAVNQLNLRGLQNPGGLYKPTVSISTKNFADRIEIKVQDNGGGIPQEIKEKIFQPFFTTKPTGEGTGLGLSMSYDIIVKGHNGTMSVESSQDKGLSGEQPGTTFIISLPK